MFILRVRGDVRPARVRAYGLRRDVCVRACASPPSRLQRLNVDDLGHRANARASALLLRACVRVRVPSLSLLLT